MPRLQLRERGSARAPLFRCLVEIRAGIPPTHIPKAFLASFLVIRTKFPYFPVSPKIFRGEKKDSFPNVRNLRGVVFNDFFFFFVDHFLQTPIECMITISVRAQHSNARRSRGEFVTAADMAAASARPGNNNNGCCPVRRRMTTTTTTTAVARGWWTTSGEKIIFFRG